MERACPQWRTRTRTAARTALPSASSCPDIVSISANSFPVSTPEDFLSFLKANAQSGPTAAKPTPVEQFLASHPAAAKWVSTPRPAPDSFGTLAFYGINAFKFTNAKGVSRYARYQILPVAGEHALSKEDTAKAQVGSEMCIRDRVKVQKALLFNPVSLTDGIEASADPILQARFPAYAVSFGQRAQ